MDQESLAPNDTGLSPVFYRVDNRAVTFGEAMLITSKFTGLVFWIISRILRVLLTSITYEPPVESLAPFETVLDNLPQSLQDATHKDAPHITSLGFHSPIFHAIHDHTHNAKTYLATYAHRSLPVVLRAEIRIWSIRTPPHQSGIIEIISAARDGSILCTSTARAETHDPPNVTYVRANTTSPAELLQLHQAELARLRFPAIPAHSPELAHDIIELHHAVIRDYYLARGIFRPLTPREASLAAAAAVAAGQSSSAPDQALDAQAPRNSDATPQGQSRYPEVLAEIARLQNRQSGWVALAILLIISIALFLGLGVPGVKTWSRLLTLVPILLVHELGHFVAMKAFGYRNLRMFFIPGFGAAVSGNHYNVPGWKQAVVALMGPVPSIFLGVVVGLAGIVFHIPTLLDIAFLTVLVNGFNLVPLLPFDGGRVLHVTLFSRSFILDIGFRAVAAAAVFFVGLKFNDRIFIAVGVALLTSFPAALRIARISRDIRGQGPLPPSPDGQTIPPQAADRIIDRLRETSNAPINTRILAQQTLTTYETVSTRPPGILATLGLLTTHAFVAALAVVFLFVMVAARNGNFGGRSRGLPPNSFVASDVRETGPSVVNGSNQRPPILTVVATFDSAGEASGAFSALAPTLPPEARAVLLPPTVMVAIPETDTALREALISAFKPKAKDIFLDGPTMSAAFRITAVVLDKKQDPAGVSSALDGYFSLPLHDHVLPPWDVLHPQTPEQSLSRHTYIELGGIQVPEGPEYDTLLEKAEDAHKLGNTRAAEQYEKQYRELRHNALRSRIEAIASDASGAYDTRIAHAYLAAFDAHYAAHPDADPDDDDFTYERSVPYSAAFGCWTPALAPAPDLSARSGYSMYKDLALEINALAFTDPVAAAPAFLRWLESKGASAIRFEVTSNRYLSPAFDTPPPPPSPTSDSTGHSQSAQEPTPQVPGNPASDTPSSQPGADSPPQPR